MHLNYFALRHFSNALHHRLHGCTFINAFSFSKDEIVFSFLTPDNKEIFLAANLVNKSCYFRFLYNYNRPKRNYLYQFDECNGGIVDAVVQVNFDRSFYIKLKTGFKILFKLHGGFSNILSINESDEVEDLFKKEFLNDRNIELKNLDKTFDLDSLSTLHLTDYSTIKKIIPLMDELSLDYLKSIDFIHLSVEERKIIMEKYFSSAPVSFYLTEASSKSYLQIFPKNDAVKYDDPLEAYSRLSALVLPSYQLSNLKNQAEEKLITLIKKAEKQINSISKQLENSLAYTEYENLGHIIMANMHSIPKQTNKAELFDFYKNTNVIVRLDKNLNPQENAEKYYRKSKALKLELPNIRKNLEEVNKEKDKLSLLLEKLESINDTKSLKTFATDNNLLKVDEEKPSFPFRKMMVDDFEVWIGKNAANNDLLTFGYAHKNDIWMHAKDVSGSHVIIKNQSGKIITKPTIEKAARIAAYYSKSKNQGLAAVQYTVKKFVVKSKGRNPGEVHLLSEQTVLVKPGIQ